jgi:dCMP deaminase
VKKNLLKSISSKKGKDGRPDVHDYFMNIAMSVRRRANCLGNRVGAIIVLDGRIISTGYNGTPHGMKNCLDGGCHRCANRAAYPSGTGYDLCICVHAEQNALLSAARFGIAAENGVIYTTMRPCFGCTKEMLQAKIKSVFFLHDWTHPDLEKRKQYEDLQSYFSEGIHRLEMKDLDEAWAISSKRQRVVNSMDETGHS